MTVFEYVNACTYTIALNKLILIIYYKYMQIIYYYAHIKKKFPTHLPNPNFNGSGRGNKHISYFGQRKRV
jgi:uncharacterized membrane protein